MLKAVKTIAKLQMPQLASIYPQKRLFNKLDIASKSKLIWLSDVAGSGKTTLVANYLSTYNKNHLWYRLDADDNDPASFFYYMALAAKNIAPRKKLLPALTSEYQMGVLTFARRFFEQLYSQLKPPCTLVFDNYERLSENSILHAILREAVEALPDEIIFFIISRQPPPACFAKLQASQRFAHIDSDALHLTKEEAYAIAQIHSKKPLKKSQLNHIYLLSQGWMAGLILLARAKTLPTKQQPEALSQTLFDYFAEEVFLGINSKSRRIIQQLAVMPFISETNANKLTGTPLASHILNKLTSEHLFTYRYELKKATYQLHPLFRAFLLKQAKENFTIEEFAEIKLKAAKLLEAEAYIEAAFDLYVAAGQFSEAARLICQQAPTLLQQGRFITLLGWISQLPQSMLEQAPWLLYWSGIGNTFPDPMKARISLEQAYFLFVKQKNDLGAILSCCGIIVTFPMLWDDFHKMDVWIDNLESFLDQSPTNAPIEIESQIINAMVLGYFYRRIGDPQLQVWAGRSQAMLPDAPDPFIRVMLLQHCLCIHIWKGELGKASLMLEQMRPVLTGKASNPFSAIWFHTNQSCYYWNNAETDKSIKSAETALKISNDSGVHVMDALAHYHAGIANVADGRVDAARRNLKNLQPLILPGQIMNEASCHQLAGTIAWHDGELNKAHEMITQAAELTEKAGLNFAHALQLIGLAIIQFERGGAKQAVNTLKKSEHIAQADKLPYLLFEIELFKTYFYLKQGDKESALKALDNGLKIGTQTSRVASSWWSPHIMNALCAEAIEAGLHVEYVHLIIRKRKLLPNSEGHTLEQWPWPVRIYTLGGLRIEIDNEALEIGNKSPAKPLELLKVLIALGGENIKATRLADILWPDAEGDNAFESFKTTLRRLRKLLQHKNVLPLKEGRLSLNQDICWTDAQALLGLSGTASKPEDIIRLYTGSFLSDEDTPWSMQLREQLRNIFLQSTLKQGQYFQNSDKWQQAINCYEKGLSVEKRAEAFYQQIIICYQKNNLPAEALHAYDRCKATLEQEFGILPSSKTLKLSREIKTEPLE